MNNPKIAFSSTHPSEMRGRPDVLLVDNSRAFASAQFRKAADAGEHLFMKPSPIAPSSNEDGR
jgi:hypothetical protein